MGKKATREAYGNALVALGRLNPQVVVLDADLSKSTKTSEFAREFPERFFDMGVAEQNMLGTAAGLALAGKIPFVSTFAVFATGRAYDQIRNSIAYPRLNVKIAATHAGLTVGEDGASHQALEDITLMRVIPGMTVIVPADARETEQALAAAAEAKGPFYLRLGRMEVPDVHGEDYQFRVGYPSCLREGTDAAIITCGVMVGIALEAAVELASHGYEVAVYNFSTIKPLNADVVVRLARETGALVCAEEHSIIGGLGSAVAEVLAEQLPVPMERVGVQDSFGQSGKPMELMEKYGLGKEGVIAAVERVIRRKKAL